MSKAVRGNRGSSPPGGRRSGAVSSLRIPLSYPRICMWAGCNPFGGSNPWGAPPILCTYCRRQLTELEIHQLHEEDCQSPYNLFHGVWRCSRRGISLRFYGACARCRLFLTNA
nr:E6 protein [Anas platyrhynchos papillomavirus 3]